MEAGAVDVCVHVYVCDWQKKLERVSGEGIPIGYASEVWVISFLTDSGQHQGLVRRKVKVKVAQLGPTLCDPMDYTVHGILQARILEWVAFPFSRAFSQPRNRTQVSRIAGRLFTS